MLGSNTPYINFCLFKQIPMASILFLLSKVSILIFRAFHTLFSNHVAMYNNVVCGSART